MFNKIEEYKNNINNKTNKIIEILIKQTISKDITWSKIERVQGEYTAYLRKSISNNGFQITMAYLGNYHTKYYIYLDEQLLFMGLFKCDDNNEIYKKLTQLWDYVDKIENFPNEEIKYKNTEIKLDAALERLECINNENI